MKTVPSDVLVRFSRILTIRKVPFSRHGEYRKWLRYYLDFCDKYSPPPVRSERVRLFIRKLQEKKQPLEFQKQAAHAVSLLFETEQRGNRISAELAVPLSDGDKADGPTVQHPSGTDAASISAAQTDDVPIEPSSNAGTNKKRFGARYDEWRCLNRTQSPEWDAVIDGLAAEIKTRHILGKR